MDERGRRGGMEGKVRGEERHCRKGGKKTFIVNQDS
jgi:hypothetical protein